MSEPEELQLPADLAAVRAADGTDHEPWLRAADALPPEARGSDNGAASSDTLVMTGVANQIEDINGQLAEAVETLRAIRNGEVDALVVDDGSPATQVFTLSSADRPYRLFVESMRDGAATVDASGLVLYANLRLAEMLGVDVAAVLAAPLTDFVVDEHHEMLATQHGAAGTAAMIEIELIGPDRPIPVRVGAATLEVDGERLVCLTFADLTQDRRDQAELRLAHRRAVDASRLKSDFVANMSHEIRTPLNGVIGMSALLLDTVLTAEQREYVDAVRISGDALMAVINDILDFSKIEAGKLELDSVPFNLLSLVEDVGSLVAGAAHAKGVELLLHVDPALPDCVAADVNRLRQILTNLMNNAVKFTASGEVSTLVTGRPTSTGWLLSFAVTDTGIGVTPDSLDRIFDSFAQADGSTTRQYGGTGLGLTISKHLVALMGGEIGVDSVEGIGSTFHFTVLSETVASMPAATDATAAHAGLAGLRALVVDDNDSCRRSLVHRLTSWGMNCVSASSGAEALEVITGPDAADRPFDVVLLDSPMPGPAGWEVVEAIRSAGAPHRTSILLLLSSQSRREAGRPVAVDGFLTKPVRISRLQDELLRLLASPDGGGAPGSYAPAQLIDDDAEEQTGTPPAPVGGKVTAAAGLVLLAEDNDINQLVTRRMLEKRGFEVHVARNGREAVEMNAAAHYKAIFMDCHMPVLDGYAATQEIRDSEGPGPQVPIIAMTANTMKGDRERCLAAGMDDYVGKPVDPDALTDAIGRSVPGAASPAVARPPLLGDPEPDLDLESGEPLIDESALAGLTDDDPELYGELVTMFDDQAVTLIAELDVAIRAADSAAIEAVGHQLKGSAASVGAMRVSQLAEDVCAAGQAGRLDELAPLLGRLERAAAQTRSAWALPSVAPLSV